MSRATGYAASANHISGSGDAYESQFAILLIVARDERRLARAWVETFQKSSVREEAYLTLVYPRKLSKAMRRLVGPYSRVRLLEVAGNSEERLSVAAVSDLDHLHQPFVVAIRASTNPDWTGLISECREARSRLNSNPSLTIDGYSGSERVDPRPVLLPIKSLVRPFLWAYIDAYRTGTPLSVSEKRYLTYLASTAVVARLEYMHGSSSRPKIRIWLDDMRLTPESEPVWTGRIVFEDTKGKRFQSEPGVWFVRHTRMGREFWSELDIDMPLDALGTGTYRLSLDLLQDGRIVASGMPVLARVGVLLSAEPRDYTNPGKGFGQSNRITRYIFHTSGDDEESFLTVLRASRLVKVRWALKMLSLDVRYIYISRNSRYRYLRFLRMMTKPLFVGRDVWLIAERYDTAQDNGYRLFKHIRDSVPELSSCYFVIDPEADDYAKVRDLGKVVRHSSIWHKLLTLHASVLAYAYSSQYVLPKGWSLGEYASHLGWRTGAKHVFLQHGIHMNPRAVRRGATGYSLMLTSNKREHHELERWSGYSEQLRMTGLPRYDALRAREPSRKILFMSTWRQYLVPDLFGRERNGAIEFHRSAYGQFFSAFLASDRLSSLLDRYDYILEFVPHYNMARFFDGFGQNSDRVATLDPRSADIQELLVSCDVLLTDYSSVHFDVAYLGTPVIYTRFDEKEYNARHSSEVWFDARADGFGPVVETIEGSLDALESLLAANLTVSAKYENRAREFFPFRDAKFCERVVREIRSLK